MGRRGTDVVRRCKNSRGSVDGDLNDKKCRSMELPSYNNEKAFSSAVLARKLDELRSDILKRDMGTVAAVELRDFDMIDTEEAYLRKREEIRRSTDYPEHFDSAGKTELNYGGAAIAGAKLLIDERRATRSMSKRLMNDCGIEEDEILYKPLAYAHGTDLQSAKEVAGIRKASVVESLVDFQRQIQFKMNVLKFVAGQHGDISGLSKSDTRYMRRRGEVDSQRKGLIGKQKNKNKPVIPRTPSENRTLNPLDDKRIIEEYALEVASEVRDNSRKRRRIAPIPFNINLLDDDDELMKSE